MRFDPRDFVFIRADIVEISAVRPRKEIGRLKEMDVCVDVAGQNKFAPAIDPSRPLCRINRPGTADLHNAIMSDQDSGVFSNGAAGGIDDRAAHELELVRAR